MPFSFKFSLILSTLTAVLALNGHALESNRDLPLLSFEELEIARDHPQNASVNAKIARLFRSAQVVNTTSQNGISKSRPEIGKHLSIATWNVEKSLEITQVLKALNSEKDFLALVAPALKGNSKKLAEILRQRTRLVTADIILLQEMDYGVSRSNYLSAAKEIARVLKMNFAYAPYQIEIDPHLMYLETNHQEAVAEHQQNYRGLFGSAILSRYPIKKVVNFPLKNGGYDWYQEEIKHTIPAKVEIIRRGGAKLLFDVDIEREIKRGVHNFFRVDLNIPEVEGGTLTVINAHLEIKGPSEMREKQIQEILSYVQDVQNPLILAGDFNSSNSDIRYFTNYRLIKDLVEPEEIVSYAITVYGPSGLGLGRKVVNFLKNYRNPLAFHIPLLSPNPSKKILNVVKNFVFSDGGKFDFRGDELRSQSRNGKASNSNEREFFGYETTFKLPQTPLGFLGRYKLDWIFVKSTVKEKKWYQNKQFSYQLSPHFGETLYEFNQSISEGPMSDHQPLVVDLPLQEPEELNLKQRELDRERSRQRAQQLLRK